jgi:exonuclease III
VVFWWCLIIV